ncbi:polymer-forming cytoskeletal family protein [Helicobacter pylori]|uniref:bactofilin family protein n=1 Tax=Helicobacter pylori TaxID=210 RepID=UPI000D35D970|nr:polymer-forming cytoskeletal protein [Helicobacter pylori]PUD56723.1 polymer-forming cytoskeletal family protein [Helicobacter pylori]
MAIFDNNNKSANAKTGPATIIAQGTKIKGELHLDYHLHIDGELEGVVHSKSVVVIGQTGSVVGEIFANKLVVSGKFTGTVEAEVVEIMPLGRLDGKISSQELVVERKGILIGETRPKNIQGGALLINEQEKKIENK